MVSFGRKLIFCLGLMSAASNYSSSTAISFMYPSESSLSLSLSLASCSISLFKSIIFEVCFWIYFYLLNISACIAYVCACACGCGGGASLTLTDFCLIFLSSSSYTTSYSLVVFRSLRVWKRSRSRTFSSCLSLRLAFRFDCAFLTRFCIFPATSAKFWHSCSFF